MTFLPCGNVLKGIECLDRSNTHGINDIALTSEDINSSNLHAANI